MNNKTKEQQVREEIVEQMMLFSETNKYQKREYCIDKIMAIFAREQDKREIEVLKGYLRRINLNESNDYPLVDESKSLADVKEAMINRIGQLTTQLPEEKEA